MDFHEAEQVLGKARVAEICACAGEVLRQVMANPARYRRHRSANEPALSTFLGAEPQLS